jgi:hypothetical protein
MANTGFKGVDVRQDGNQLVFRAFLQTSAGAMLATGTTTVKLYELQSDGTIKSYDFNDNTFKTTALTTETLSLTHRPGNNSGTNTGIWTAALSTLTGFTVGGMYFALFNNSGASPTDQVREFQYGGAEGSLLVTAGSTGQAYLQVDMIKVGGTTQTARDVGASVLLSVGTGTGQVNLSGGKIPATLAATDVTGNVPADLQTIKTQTVTCGAGVTVGAFVGNATHAITVDGSGFVTYSNTAPPTAAAIATAVLTDTTDTSTAGSLGHLITTAPSWYTAPTTPPTAAAIAAAVLTDTTDLSTAGSLGYLVGHAPSWYSAPPSAATIAAAVLTDTTDTATVGSLGYLLGHAPSWYTAPDNSDIASLVTSVGVGLGGLVTGVKAKTDLLTFDGSNNIKSNAQVVQDKTGYKLASDGVDAVVIEAATGPISALNLRQALSMVLSFVGGLLSITGTSATAKSPGGTSRAAFTVDSSGNRSSMTYTPPA